MSSLTKFCDARGLATATLTPEAGAQRHLLSDAGRQERSGSTLRFVVSYKVMMSNDKPP
ncbi:MAG: hypothetical protein RMX59_019130 [Nostoc sp. DedSLP05]